MTQAPTIESAQQRCTDIANRIAAENVKLANEDIAEKELTRQRQTLLTQGTDQQVDACESKIDLSRANQVRILERIELLEGQLQQAKADAESVRLDTLTNNAKELRARSTKILQTIYPALAKKVADALKEIAANEAVLAETNIELVRAKREPIPAADAQRFDSPPGPHGYSISLLPLHEVVNLPSEATDAAPYWAPRDVNAELALTTLRLR